MMWSIEYCTLQIFVTWVGLLLRGTLTSLLQVPKNGALTGFTACTRHKLLRDRYSYETTYEALSHSSQSLIVQNRLLLELDHPRDRYSYETTYEALSSQSQSQSLVQNSFFLSWIIHVIASPRFLTRRFRRSRTLRHKLPQNRYSYETTSTYEAHSLSSQSLNVQNRLLLQLGHPRDRYSYEKTYVGIVVHIDRQCL